MVMRGTEYYKVPNLTQSKNRAIRHHERPLVRRTNWRSEQTPREGNNMQYSNEPIKEVSVAKRSRCNTSRRHQTKKNIFPQKSS
jgi:hypothetical protein